MTDENKEDYPKPVLVEDLGMLFPKENSKRKTRFGIYNVGSVEQNLKVILTTLNVVLLKVVVVII